ncbi:hypothetical protein HanIR_Chr09g0401541 [Helianthus annuus]|nr:hypothetical protein HanIR_Chr09g0401541 [Helianthus annuus]
MPISRLRPGLAWRRSPTPTPSVRLGNFGSHSPVLTGLLLSHIPIHTYIYIHKGAHLPSPRFIPFKPLLHGGDVTAHPLEDEALHTLQS